VQRPRGLRQLRRAAHGGAGGESGVVAWSGALPVQPLLPHGETMVSFLGWLRAREAMMKRRTADGPDSPQKTQRAAGRPAPGGSRPPVAAVALTGRHIAARVTELWPLGEFATCRDAPAAGDLDLDSFRLRLDPIAATDGLLPGMTMWSRG
jgi:hypothetical protein